MSQALKVVSVYEPRHVVAMDNARVDDWELKVYWLTPEASEPDPGSVAIAIEASMAALEDAEGYGAGFLIVHRGEMATWVILFWWTNQDILRQRIWQTDNGVLVDVGDQNFVACVWELSIVDWERKAWINHVLRDAHSVAPESYLKATYPSSFC